MISLLRLNDWKMADFLKIALFLQLALFVSISSEFLGFDFSIFRIVISFVFLLFIPGLALLRVFKIHNLEIIETILYSVGLSIAYLMIIGLATNEVLPIFGISNPMSTVYLLLVINVSMLVLYAIGYFRDKDYSGCTYGDSEKISVPLTVALCLLPILSIIGTQMMNFFGDNTILLSLLVIVSIMPILAMFDRFPKNLYPIAILAIALSLVYHYSLISSYITGWDIQTEFYFADLVVSNSYWTSSIASNYNGMLSVVMVGPVLSIMSNLSLVWIFKIFYPFIFALVPLGLYRVFKSQTNEKIAFLSCFFFVGIFTFYSEMLTLARQQIAEIFLLLIVFLIVDKKLSTVTKSALSFIFAFCLITSHYGLSYLYLFSIVAVWFALRIKNWQRRTPVISGSTVFVLLFVVFALLWYVYISRSSIIDQGFMIADNITSNLFDLLNPSKTEGLNIILSAASSPMHAITKVLYYVLNFAIFLGVAATFFKRIENKFGKQFFLFALVNFLMLVACIAVPFFASTLNASRIYQISLFFLAPFAVIGFTTFFAAIDKFFKTSLRHKTAILKLLAVFFVVFFLFDSGFVYQVTNSNPTSIPLNNQIDYSIFNKQEIVSANWVADHIAFRSPLFSDTYRQLLLSGVTGSAQMFVAEEDLRVVLPMPTYVFLGSRSVEDGTVSIVQQVPREQLVHFPIQNLSLYDTLVESNRVYDNGGSQVYYDFW